MNPKADELIVDVRRAVRLEQKPTVTTDSQLVDSETIAGLLYRAAFWLTPKHVEAYDRSAFAAWAPDMQVELENAVKNFREIAGAVPQDKRTTETQFRNGVQAFTRLKKAVQRVAISEWQTEAGRLLDRVEAWAKDFGWPIRRHEKKLDELLLGEYVLGQLYMHAEGSLYILDPVARFVPGGAGTFDLSIQPSFNTTSVYRHKNGEWCIRLVLKREGQRVKTVPISADSLKQAVAELKSLR